MKTPVLLCLLLFITAVRADRTTDSLALISLLKVNPAHTLDWDTTASMFTWNGITIKNERVTEVVISNKKISVLPPEIGNLTELTAFWSSMNPIRAVPREISQWRKLYAFTLSNSRMWDPEEGLTELPEEFGSLPLKILNLDGNGFKTFPEAVTRLANLKQFSFQFSIVDSLPSSIGNLDSLWYLDISGGTFTTLPEGFGNLKKLRTFYAARGNLAVLPESFGNCTELSELIFTSSDIATLPESFGNLKKLKSLEIDRTKMNTLPAVIGQCSSLTSLDLYDNKLTVLPNELVNLKELRTLQLAKNQITALPNEIGSLKQLINLYLNDNLITELPESIGNCSSLVRLHLQDNQIETLPHSISNLTALELLEISRNKLRNIAAHDFSTMTSLVLRDFDVDSNQLSFEDLEALYTVPSYSSKSSLYGVGYASQSYRYPLLISEDSTVLIVDATSKENSYYWQCRYKETNRYYTLENPFTDSLVIEKGELDSLYYFCKITNNTFSNLTLESDTLETAGATSALKPVTAAPGTLALSQINNSLFLSLPVSGDAMVEIFSIRGQLIEKIIFENSRVGVHELSLQNNLASGNYLAKVTTETKSIAIKFSY